MTFGIILLLEVLMLTVQSQSNFADWLMPEYKVIENLSGWDANYEEKLEVKTDGGNTDHLESLISSCRTNLKNNGYCAFPNFMDLSIIKGMYDEFMEIKVQKAIRNHTVYQDPIDPNYPADHPRNQLFASRVTVIARNQLPDTLKLVQFYKWKPILNLLRRVLGDIPLYLSGDTQGSVYAIIDREGDHTGFHLDEHPYTAILVVHKPEQGGVFEMAPWVADPKNNETTFDNLGKVFRGETPMVKIAPPLGSFFFFQGNRSVHHVTPVIGKEPRVSAVFCFATAKGWKNRADVQATRWERTEEEIKSGKKLQHELKDEI